MGQKQSRKSEKSVISISYIFDGKWMYERDVVTFMERKCQIILKACSLENVDICSPLIVFILPHLGAEDDTIASLRHARGGLDVLLIFIRMKSSNVRDNRVFSDNGSQRVCASCTLFYSHTPNSYIRFHKKCNQPLIRTVKMFSKNNPSRRVLLETDQSDNVYVRSKQDLVPSINQKKYEVFYYFEDGWAIEEKVIAFLETECGIMLTRCSPSTVDVVSPLIVYVLSCTRTGEDAMTALQQSRDGNDVMLVFIRLTSSVTYNIVEQANLPFHIKQRVGSFCTLFYSYMKRGGIHFVKMPNAKALGSIKDFVKHVSRTSTFQQAPSLRQKSEKGQSFRPSSREKESLKSNSRQETEQISVACLQNRYQEDSHGRTVVYYCTDGRYQIPLASLEVIQDYCDIVLKECDINWSGRYSPRIVIIWKTEDCNLDQQRQRNLHSIPGGEDACLVIVEENIFDTEENSMWSFLMGSIPDTVESRFADCCYLSYSYSAGFISTRNIQGLDNIRHFVDNWWIRKTEHRDERTLSKFPHNCQYPDISRFSDQHDLSARHFESPSHWDVSFHHFGNNVATKQHQPFDTLV